MSNEIFAFNQDFLLRNYVATGYCHHCSTREEVYVLRSVVLKDSKELKIDLCRKCINFLFDDSEKRREVEESNKKRKPEDVQETKEEVPNSALELGKFLLFECLADDNKIFESDTPFIQRRVRDILFNKRRAGIYAPYSIPMNAVCSNGLYRLISNSPDWWEKLKLFLKSIFECDTVDIKASLSFQEEPKEMIYNLIQK